MQTRLVAPHVSSLNAHDAYILVTSTSLYQFNGSQSSVLKKSKGTEICNAIAMAKEYKCMADRVRLS